MSQTGGAQKSLVNSPCPSHMLKVVTMQQATMNAGGEVVALTATVSGFVDSLPAIMTFIATTFAVIWYGIHIYDWYVLHRITTKVTIEKQSKAGMVKTTTEVTTAAKKAEDHPPYAS
jgi:purine-cytosine permease-like protein